MTTPFKALSLMVFLAMLIFVPSTLAQAGTLIGVWRITEARIVPASDQTQKPTEIKNYRPDIIIFTKSNFSWVDNHGESLPDLQEENPNVAYFATAFNQLTTFSGAYEVKGSSITAPVIMSKMPDAISEGSSLNFEYKFEGDMLVLTWHTPKKYNILFKLQRLK